VKRSLEVLPDGILAERAADGDATAFEVLVFRHGSLMRAYAVRVLGNQSEAEDVVQDVLIQAWGQLDRLNDPNAVKSWLMRMVSNRAIDRIRRRREHSEIEDWNAPAPSHQSPERVVEVRMQMSALASVLDRLPAMQRECWMLKETGGLSYVEIAESLGVPTSTVRGQLARARQTVLREMEVWR
jgi:RNA polymerase sigma-70 factor (ECF subfamily)